MRRCGKDLALLLRASCCVCSGLPRAFLPDPPEAGLAVSPLIHSEPPLIHCSGKAAGRAHLEGLAHAHLVGQDAAAHAGLLLGDAPGQELALVGQQRYQSPLAAP